MTLRPATRSDIPLIEALARSIWNAVYPSIISQAQIDYMLERMYSPAQIETEMNAGFDWKIVVIDGESIGFVSTIIENGTVLKVSKIYLEPAFHGRGMGQAILDYVDAKASFAGVESIYLYVNRNNARAIRAYVRAGYSIAETLDQEFGPFVLNDYKLIKTL